MKDHLQSSDKESFQGDPNISSKIPKLNDRNLEKKKFKGQPGLSLTGLSKENHSNSLCSFFLDIQKKLFIPKLSLSHNPMIGKEKENK